MNTQTKTILAVALLGLMFVHVYIKTPPVWILIVAPPLGLFYYIIRAFLGQRTIADILIAGVETIIATVMIYALLVFLLGV